jgi:hypothetical protein
VRYSDALDQDDVGLVGRGSEREGGRFEIIISGL